MSLPYIRGYYCPSEVEINLIQKESNRKIIDALREEAYPSGKTAHEIAEIAGLPLKTTYPQLNELTRAGFITQLPKKASISSRGRPKIQTELKDHGSPLLIRQHRKYILEETKGIYDIYNGRKQKNKKTVPLPPGNVVYSDDFLDLWNKIVAKEDEDELSKLLLRFLERITIMISESHDEAIKNIAPTNGIESCCSLCGLNHQARDFMRAMLLHLVDQLEENGSFIKFLHSNQYLTQEAYQNIAKKLEVKNNELAAQEKKSCNHFANIVSSIDERSVVSVASSSKAQVCQECEKDNIQWISLRLCVTCGNIGCDDSSKGMHATKHFVNTGHPVIVALPDKPWKWCYIHKIYG
jgi:Zn-finger in ubiquitin-hydrolases and other protein